MSFSFFLKTKTKKQTETAAALKRTIEALMDRGAVVRNLENLGERALPYKMSAHSQRHNRGGYVSYDVKNVFDPLSEEYCLIRLRKYYNFTVRSLLGWVVSRYMPWQ